MTTKRTRKKTSPAPDLAVGDFVLMGGTRASYPGEWYLGEVLWVGHGDLLLNRSTMNGESYRQTCMVSEVRAKGTIEQLIRVQNEAREAVKVFADAVRDVESALGAARNALFGKLDDLAAAGMQIIPPDFDQIDVDSKAITDAAHAVDVEAAGRVMASYGIWVEPIGDAAETDEPGFLTNCGGDLSYSSRAYAEQQLDMKLRDDDCRSVVLSVREKTDAVPSDAEIDADLCAFERRAA